MVETVTESISKTKDEWIQQFLLDKARNDKKSRRILIDSNIYKTAKNFKELGIDVGTIQKATGLSAEEIASL